MGRRFYDILVHLIFSLNVALAGKLGSEDPYGAATERRELKTGSLHLQLRAEKSKPRDLGIRVETSVDVEDLVRLIREIAKDHPDEIRPGDLLEKSTNNNHGSEQFLVNSEEENYIDSPKSIHRYDKNATMQRRSFEILDHLNTSLNVALAGKLGSEDPSGAAKERREFKTGSLHLQLRAEKSEPRDLAIRVETSVDVEDLVRLIREIAKDHPDEIRLGDLLKKSNNNNHGSEQFLVNSEEENYIDSPKSIHRYDKMQRRFLQRRNATSMMQRRFFERSENDNDGSEQLSENSEEEKEENDIDSQRRIYRYDQNLAEFLTRQELLKVANNLRMQPETLNSLARHFSYVVGNATDATLANSKGLRGNETTIMKTKPDGATKVVDYERPFGLVGITNEMLIDETTDESTEQIGVVTFYEEESVTSSTIVDKERLRRVSRLDDEKEEGGPKSKISRAKEKENSSAYAEEDSDDFSNGVFNTNININSDDAASPPKVDGAVVVGSNDLYKNTTSNKRANETANPDAMTRSGKKLDEDSEVNMKPLGGNLKFLGASSNVSREDDSSKKIYVMDVLLEAINAIIASNMSKWTEPASTEKFLR